MGQSKWVPIYRALRECAERSGYVSPYADQKLEDAAIGIAEDPRNDGTTADEPNEQEITDGEKQLRELVEQGEVRLLLDFMTAAQVRQLAEDWNSGREDSGRNPLIGDWDGMECDFGTHPGGERA